MNKYTNIFIVLGFLLFWISTTATVAWFGEDIKRIEDIKKIEVSK